MISPQSPSEAPEAGRAGADGPLMHHARRTTCGTCAPGPTRPAPTARRNASSRSCCGVGPMPSPIPRAPTGRAPSSAGCGGITAGAPTARWTASRPSAVSHTLYVPVPWIDQGHSERAGTDRSHLGRRRPLQSRVVPARTLAQSPNSCRGREHEPASARQGAWPALPEGTQWRHQRT